MQANQTEVACDLEATKVHCKDFLVKGKKAELQPGYKACSGYDGFSSRCAILQSTALFPHISGKDYTMS
jgi:hypothetical protein